MKNEIAIQLNGLRKNYGAKEAVKGIDLDIFRGELFVLVGANGAGKTSTLKMLTGLLKPTAGMIQICGLNLQQKTKEVKKLMSFVPDIPYIYEKLSPWEIIRFVGKLYEMDRGAIETRGKELLQFFSLWHVRDVLTEEFSHGMRQKTVLCAALVHNPEIFILDEPMVGLDPVSILDFKVFLKQKTKEGMTVIFSTHTLATAEELADRIAIMHQGRIVALGTLDELRTQYRSKENLEQMFMEMIKTEDTR
ncbi:MAG: hypothetical protein A2Z83_08830 [Omnitrophica bacterium GWA2_52_8]|nr:MAG: hypothetical protein A2Z83_08830 [Omnitrophica bacterium GWA2_52_8]